MSEYDDLLARVRSGQPEATPAAEDYSGLLARVRGQPDPSAVQANLNIVSFKQPDQEAERLQIAKQLKEKLGEDWSPAAVDPLEAKRRLRVVENDHALRNAPKLAQRFMDQGFAGMAHDDVLTLSAIERTVLGTAGDIGIVALKGAVGLPQAFIGIADIFTGGNVGRLAERAGLRFNETQKILDDLYSPAQQQANKAVRNADGFTDTVLAALQNPSTIAATAGESLPQMLGGAGIARGALGLGAKTVGAGMAGPNLPGWIAQRFGDKLAPILASAIGEGAIGAGSAAEQIRETNDDGLLSAKQQLAALGSGVGTGLFSVVGGKLAQKFGVADIDTALVKGGMDEVAAQTLKKGFARRLAEAGVSEGIFEELPQSAQEQVWQNFATDRPLTEGVGNAAAMGMLAGMATGGAVETVNRFSQRLEMAAFKEEDAKRADQLVTLLEGMNKLAEASKLRERDVETAAGYFQTLMDEGRDAVYISPEAFAQSGMAEQIAQAIPAVAEQLETAIQTGHDIRLPIADLMARMPGEALAQSILPHVADEPGGFTRTTAQEYMQSGQAQELQALVEQTLSEKQGNDALRASSQEVEADVLGQLNSIGRFTTDANQAYAKLMAEFFTVMAGKTGVTPAELYQQYKPTIVSQGVKGLNQRSAQTDTPEFRNWFGDSKVVDAEGKPLVVYHGTAADFDTFKTDSDLGAHFGSEQQANVFAAEYNGESGGRVVPVFLSMKNPLHLEDRGGFYAKDVVPQLAEIGILPKGAAYSQFSGPSGVLALQRAIRAAGYDGVVYANAREGAGDSYIAFRSEQIKSATGNRGTFDPNDPNILNQSGQPPVVALTGQELGEGISPENVVERAGQWFKNNLQGETVAREGLGDIRISGKTWKKIKRGLPIDLDKARLIPAIPEIIRSGEYQGRFPVDKERPDQIVAFHFFQASVEMGGKAYDVGVSVGEDQFGNLVYNLNRDPQALLENRKAPLLPRLEARGAEPSEGSDGTLKQSIDPAGDGINIDVVEQASALDKPALGAYDPETRTIGLLKAANLSTFLHESGHFFLEVMADIASRPDAPANIRADMDATLQWFGIQGSPNVSALEVWRGMTLDEKRPYHEKWAETFEQYLMTGKTPSLELRQAFQKFKDWLLRVYQSLKQFAASHPTADLSPEISQVFDRMLAADEQIKLAEQARSMIALFESPEQGGMTPEEFAAYQALAQDATEAAKEEFEAKGIRDMKWLANARSKALKALQAEANGARSLVMMEARREVMQQPVYQAWQFLVGKPQTMPAPVTDADIKHAAAVQEWEKERQETEDATRERLRLDRWANSADSAKEYPTGQARGMAKGQFFARYKKDINLDVQKAMLEWERANPKPEATTKARAEDAPIEGFDQGKLSMDGLESIGLPVEIINHLKALKMTAKDGWHPDLVAERFGFSSGDELVRTLAAAPTPKEAIETLTDQLMIQRYAELSSPEAIERAADEAIHNEARARMVETELSALARAAGKRNILRSAAKEYAAAIIGRLKVRDLRPNQYAAAEARAAKAAEKAVKAGDVEAAAVEKRNQLLNLYATKAAYDARNELEALRREWSEFANRSDKKIGKAYDIDIVNAVRAVLGEYGIAEKRAERAMDYLKAVERYDPEMFGVLSASVEAAEANAKPWKEMTVEEVRGLQAEVEAMLHLAKRSRQMEVDGDMIDRQEVEDALLSRLNEIGIPDRIPGEGQAVTPGEQMMSKFRTFVSAARRMESWVGSVDGDVPMGPFRRFVWSRIKDAADSYRADKANYLKQFRQAFDGIAPTLKPQLIAAPELGYTFGKDTGGSAMNEILHAILHTGNDSNKKKLLLGRGWAKEMQDGSINTQAWDGFVSRLIAEGKLTKAHYDFVQSVWDLLESIKPLAQKTHRDVFGKYFDEITADEVVTPFGVYRGGYVPAMADPRVVRDAELRKLVEDENSALAFAFPTTPKGFTKARVEYNRPLMLDLRTIAQHIDKVLLFAHMEMPVRDVQRVLSQEVGKALGRVDPTAIPAMITPWLNRSAKQQVETPIPGSAGTMRFFSVLRSRAGAAAMFANLTNAVQQITGFSIAAVKVRPKLMLSATADFMKGPKAFTKAVAEASPFMAERMENEVAAMTGEINDILLNPSLLEKGQHWTMRHAYFLQSAIDNTMSPIIWTAAYNQAMEQGMDHKDAVRLADSTVRETQGSTLPEDISRIESGNAFVRLFTQFAGYFNMQANLLGTEFVKLSRDYGLKNSAGRGFFVFTMGFLIPAVMSELIVQAFRGGPDDEDKDGEYLDDWLSALFMGQVRTVTAMVPVLGQLVLGAINASNKKPYDDRIATPPVISMLETAIRAPFTLKDFAEGEAGAQKTVRDVATLISMALGLPANAAARPLGYAAGVADGRIEPASPVDAVRGAVTGVASADSKF